MKKLLIVYHTQGVRTGELADAVLRGAREIDDVETVMKHAFDTGVDDLTSASGVIFGTPENFGYMSGALKDFFDRVFYPAQGKIEGMPYAIFVAAGNDGTGAVNAIDRIVRGFPLKKVAEPVIAKEKTTSEDLARCVELGMTLAAGLSVGIF
ncbi:MAG: flavodoxin family protein [Gammaproteobacteria bacterium]|nr:flavodoxin family protein [Gammaproteobacteria bacterium]